MNNYNSSQYNTYTSQAKSFGNGLVKVANLMEELYMEMKKTATLRYREKQLNYKGTNIKRQHSFESLSTDNIEYFKNSNFATSSEENSIPSLTMDDVPFSNVLNTVRNRNGIVGECEDDITTPSLQTVESDKITNGSNNNMSPDSMKDSNTVVENLVKQDTSVTCLLDEAVKDFQQAINYKTEMDSLKSSSEKHDKEKSPENVEIDEEYLEKEIDRIQKRNHKTVNKKWKDTPEFAKLNEFITELRNIRPIISKTV